MITNYQLPITNYQLPITHYLTYLTALEKGNISIGCSAFKVYFSGRGGKSKSSRLLPLSRSPVSHHRQFIWVATES
ncbi:MAG: hypothetical protein JGK38_12770 [Microcoleus sp. PH2017_15_JOR_U_A]|uniref:hypothetical protein n=1 Tax=unclassified Microcoleus TaxID=2642155 RepID=UPI001D9C1AF7|nr:MULTISPECIES: hypothetical protein [unclassified Microcoleus]MCC3497488.1 hypothetical protein [Microcoleus sp. PH2017_15_JOR_U_A]